MVSLTNLESLPEELRDIFLKNGNRLNPNQLVGRVWSLAWELAYLDVDHSGWIYHSSTNQTAGTAGTILERAMVNEETSSSVREKLRAKNVSVFSASEFDEIVAVFRLLQNWRDEAKDRPQNTKGEECGTENA